MSFDEFIQHLSPLDLQARGAASRAEYRRRYLGALRLPTAAERAQIARTFVPARLDARLQRRGLVLPREWPPCNVLVHENHMVEGGMPHTQAGMPHTQAGMPHMQGSVIVLPAWEFRSPQFASTLQHEYTHVLQRAFPAQFAEWYRTHWSVAEVPTAALGATAARRRTNPDAMSLYAPVTPVMPVTPVAPSAPVAPSLPTSRRGRSPVDPNAPWAPGAPWAALYREQPRSLSDYECVTEWEHPHERLAYELEMW